MTDAAVVEVAMKLRALGLQKRWPWMRPTEAGTVGVRLPPGVTCRQIAAGLLVARLPDEEFARAIRGS